MTALRETFRVKTVLTSDPEIAADFIRRGGIVAFPTETVYGLGADVFNEAAIAKIFNAKRRPADNPLIAHVSSIEQIAELSAETTEFAEQFIKQFFPGPLTIVLRKNERVPDIATAGLDSIGIRMPRNEIAKSFLTDCAVPLVAPSANLSGRPSPTTWQAVYEDLNRKIDCILQGDPTEIGLESTVVDCTGDTPILLRLGAISLEELQAVVPSTRIAENEVGDEVRSPGLKHKHYSPTASVELVNHVTFDEPGNVAYIGLNPDVEPHKLSLIKVCASVEEYAQSLFEFFRECDRKGIHLIYCEEVPDDGIGAALMDRIRRASRAE